MSDEFTPTGDWRTVPLHEIGDVRLGRQRSPDRAHGDHMRPYMRAANVGWDGWRIDDVKEMDFTPAEFETYALRAGDVLIGEASGSRDEVGKSCVWRDQVPGACFQNTLIRFRPDPNQVIPEFVQYRLHHDARRGALADIAKGIGIHHLGREGLANWEIDVPPLDEQRRIVAKLDALRARSRRAKDALDAVPALLDRLRQSILAAAFRGDLTADWRAKNPDIEPASELLKRIRIERKKRWEEAELAKLIAKGKPPTDDRWKSKYVEPEPVDETDLPDLPDTWCWATIDELVADRSYGTSAKTLDDSSGIPVLRMGNIDGRTNELALDSLRYLPSHHDEFPELFLATNDVLFNRTNSPEHVGKSVTYRGFPAVCSFASYLIRLRPIAVDGDLVVGSLASPRGRDWAAQAAGQQVGQANIGGAKLARFAVPLAPLIEQGELLGRVTSTFGAVRAAIGTDSEAATLLGELDSQLLARAFSGDLFTRQSGAPPSVLDE